MARPRRRVELLFLLVAVATYFNFGAFHFGKFVHNWDTFHYYVGAKYFSELRYDGFVGCEYKPAAGTAAGLGWMYKLIDRKPQ